VRLEFKSQQVALKFEQRVEFFNSQNKCQTALVRLAFFGFLKKFKG
jgi:hypothetical protein